MIEQHIEKELQRPDLGIETVAQSAPIEVSQDQFPWMSEEVHEVPTVAITLEDGVTSFRYGSLVGTNNGVEKIADEVPKHSSKGAEQGMFTALAALLNGQPASNADNMTRHTASDLPIYKTSRKGPDAPRILFAISSDEDGNPVVFKLGVAKHKKQDSLLAIFKGTPGKIRKQFSGRRA